MMHRQQDVTFEGVTKTIEVPNLDHIHNPKSFLVTRNMLVTCDGRGGHEFTTEALTIRAANQPDALATAHEHMVGNFKSKCTCKHK